MRPWMAALLCTILAPVQAASAQLTLGVDTPRGEISAGFSFNGTTDVNIPPLCGKLSLPCTSPKTFPDAGWALSAARNITDQFAVAGEISGFGNVWDSWATVHANHREINHVHSFMAGPRVATRFLHISGRDPLDLRVFGQVLAGAVVTELDAGGRAVQPGGGVDVATRSGLILRSEVDYCFRRDQIRKVSGGRWLVAIVFPIGTREP
jgi:hypothetical protein